ncbi:MAG: peptide/nickel transport system permease protein [Gammaproteobacteria bacterium]|jgi:peptide/nickel transport system permease protein|nr:peptide/nickel transport system permease protein [Gammaproteobacteria bacterium]
MASAARHPLSFYIGVCIVAAILIAAALAPWLAPYREAQFVGGVWDLPSATSWLGTDNDGRDMLTRVMFGTRTTVAIAVVATLIAFFIGAGSGFVAAAVGGWTDLVFSRCVDILLAIPVLISALMVLSVFGTSTPVLILTIGFLESTRVYFVARAVARSIDVQPFVAVARLRGEGLMWIVTREILPSALPPLIAEAGLRFCFIFLFIASLSFLGLGLQPPTADLGSMVRENALAINFGLFAPLYPAAAIALLTMGINLIVDRLLAVHARPTGHGLEI